jgi:hypothetical protein
MNLWLAAALPRQKRLPTLARWLDPGGESSMPSQELIDDIEDLIESEAVADG